MWTSPLGVIHELVDRAPLFIAGILLLVLLMTIPDTMSGFLTIYTPFILLLMMVIFAFLFENGVNVPVAYAGIGFLTVFLPLSRVVHADTAVLAGAAAAIVSYIVSERGEWLKEAGTVYMLTLMGMGHYTEPLPERAFEIFDFMSFGLYHTLSLAMVSPYFFLPFLTGVLAQKVFYKWTSAGIRPSDRTDRESFTGVGYYTPYYDRTNGRSGAPVQTGTDRKREAGKGQRRKTPRVPDRRDDPPSEPVPKDHRETGDDWHHERDETPSQDDRPAREDPSREDDSFF